MLVIIPAYLAIAIKCLIGSIYLIVGALCVKQKQYFI